MNKRIYELSEQSRKYYTKTDGSGEFWVFDENLFAESIIKECIDVIQKHKENIENSRINHPYGDDDSFWDRARIIQSNRLIDMIREHFGMKNETNKPTAFY